MNRMTWMFLAMGLLAIGCGKKSENSYKPKAAPKIQPASVKPGEEAALFPFASGNQWVYEATAGAQANTGQQSGGAFELTFKITKVEEGANGKIAFMSIIRDGKVASDQKWVVNSKGLYQASSKIGEGDFQPMQPQVMFPVTDGSEFSWSGVGPRPVGKPGPYKLNSKVLGPQEVDTGVGRLSAIAVESTGSWKDGNKQIQVATTSWWAPGIGLVRYVQNTNDGTIATAQTLKLKSHTLKN